MVLAAIKTLVETKLDDILGERFFSWTWTSPLCSTTLALKNNHIGCER